VGENEAEDTREKDVVDASASDRVRSAIVAY